MANLGYQQITSLGTAQSLTVPDTANHAFIIAETNDIRWRDDGVAPTATVGMPLTAGQSFMYKGNLAAFQAIAVSGAPKLNINYYAFAHGELS